MSNPKKIFTVWFRVGKDFKETIEAEDVYAAQRRVENKVDEEFREYLIRIIESYTTHTYDIVDGVPDE